MKHYVKILGMLTALVIALSCSKKNDENPIIIDPVENVMDGTWSLTSATGNVANVPPQTKFDYKKTISFKSSDSSFIKTYEKGDESKTAKGTFSISIDSSSSTIKYMIILKYGDKSDFVESCSKSQEDYVLNEKSELTLTSWVPCDGPSYVYRRIQVID
ncbi:MAG: hypothetical protein DI598_03190 [Pseudopedobacter saltans]|uniref:Lipocalin-like domain-containing protein n=1 Tax=Pseudopedobacter saltans TaxID=151895 RepID=A0A2W5FCV4_9SPHI|nr:MAG: hypothetical protein DI598_03190 [Pseudopedobacter saltans]